MDFGRTLRSFHKTRSIGAIAAAGWLVFAAVLGSVAAPSQAQAGLPLVAADSTAVRADLDVGVTRSQPVAIDFALIAQVRDRLLADPSTPQEVALPAFDGATLTLVLTRVESVGPAIALHGTVIGVPLSSVVLVERGGIVAGNINGRDVNYQIRYRGAGFGHELRDFDQARFRDHDHEPSSPKTPEAPDVAPAGGLKATQADDGSLIDVMVAYTAAARAAAGGTAAMQALIALGITETNGAYTNAGAIQRLRLVHSVEVAYTESGSFSTDLTRLLGKTDGFMDDVHTLRNTHGADLVSLWIEQAGGTCGIAPVMTNVSAGFEANGFNVVNRSCATGYYSFGHELGHNMGLRHDTYVDPGTTPYAYAHGYADPTHRFRTVMGYNDACAAVGASCTRIQWFANPAVNYNGFTTGNATTANARQALDNTRVTVANFRAAVVPVVTAPAITSPSNVTFYVGSPGTFTVTATGSPAPTFSLAGLVPATISLNTASGLLSGTPTALNVGIYPVQITASNGTQPNATQSFTLTVALLPTCTLDLDGNGQRDALTDGLMLMRAMFGLTGSQVTAGALGGGATRTTWAQISPLIALPAIDVDGDGKTEALTDGLILMRAMFGLTGTAATSNAIGATPLRGTWALIRTYINTTCGTSFLP